MEKILFLLSFILIAYAQTNITQTNGTMNNQTLLGRYDIKEIMIGGKKIKTTNPKKVPLWTRLQKYENETKINQTQLNEAELLNKKKKAEITKLVDEQLEKNKKYLGEIEQFKVAHAVFAHSNNSTNQTNTTTSAPKLDDIQLNNSTIDFEIPRRYRNAKCKPIVKKIYKKKQPKQRKVVEVDVLEEKVKQKKAERLIKIADAFIQNTNDDEYQLSNDDMDFLNSLDIN
ncbi:hypothetical protein ENU1_173510 [Entamoeba nuttalli P19]|uniref:Uncharacterized protein n=2 Tax=Entamoeba nuttalli TaxID=412467 RepID=K2GWQ0_ENTNP|nr:hypothetical protein ENU1_173510 [Entamoeba nuttalli P19]EKE38192.1 hypothetical protein ENU1_173510 [Entamoeba nuttalli P19]|eukprot:XP_008859460.1 hypothetical protein ENU1_173510 [Entamoeba nuttalli P19]